MKTGSTSMNQVYVQSNEYENAGIKSAKPSWPLTGMTTTTKSKKLSMQTIKISTAYSSQMKINQIESKVESLQQIMIKVPEMVRKNYL